MSLNNFLDLLQSFVSLVFIYSTFILSVLNSVGLNYVTIKLFLTHYVTPILYKSL